MIANHGGYSNSSKEKAREQIEHLKERSKQEVLIRKQKIKHLSNQTNHLRRKLEEKKLQSENEEEKRRHRILKMRKLKIDAATEKFQRTSDKKPRGRYQKDSKISQSSNDILKDGTYNVGGHVVEIRNGVRVATPSSKTKQEYAATEKPADTAFNATSNLQRNNSSNNSNNSLHLNKVSSFQQRVYEPKYYLNSHLNDLLGNNHQKNEDFGDGVNEVLFKNYKNNDNYDNFTPKHQTSQNRQQPPPSPTDSLCSNDSLNNSDHNLEENMESSSSLWEQKTLRSSLKGSASARMSESMSRKVTFSDSIEFNDGDTQPIFIPPTASIPLYKRMQYPSNPAGKPDANRLPQENNVSMNQQNDASSAVTTEQLLDQLRQEALLPKYPHNGDFSYPDSVVISRASSNIAIVSPLISDRSSNNEMKCTAKSDHPTRSNRTLNNNIPSDPTKEQQLDSLDSLNSILTKDSIEDHNNNNDINKKKDDSVQSSYVIESSNKSDTVQNSYVIESNHVSNVVATNDGSNDERNYPNTSQKNVLSKKPPTLVNTQQATRETEVLSNHGILNRDVNKLEATTNYFETKHVQNDHSQQQQQHQQQNQQQQHQQLQHLQPHQQQQVPPRQQLIHPIQQSSITSDSSVTQRSVPSAGSSEIFFNPSKYPVPQQQPPLSTITNKLVVPSPNTHNSTPTKTTTKVLHDKVSTHTDKTTNSSHMSAQKIVKNGSNSYASKHLLTGQGAITDNKNHLRNKSAKVTKRNTSVVKTSCTELSPGMRNDSTFKHKNIFTSNSKSQLDSHESADPIIPVKDGLLSPTHFAFSNKDYDQWESEKKSGDKNQDRKSPLHDIDDIYKSVEQSMACITFDNQRETSKNITPEFPTASGNTSQLQRPANNPSGDLYTDNSSTSCLDLDEEKMIAQHSNRTEDGKVSTAVKDGTSIPVRIHSSNVRRGRIIVSANSKKRKQEQNLQQQNNFTPHPPPSKSNAAIKEPQELLEQSENQEKVESFKLPLGNSHTPIQQHQRKRTNTGGDRTKMYTYTNNPRTNKSQPRVINSASSRVKSAPHISANQNKPNSARRAATAVKARTSSMRDVYYRPTSATVVAEKPSTNYFDNEGHKNKNNNIQPESSRHNQVSVLKPQSSRLPLDKTPTDDEINTLWANVRDCLSTEVPEHAFSDSVVVVEPKQQHQRSSSGTSFHYRSNSGNVRMAKTHPNRISQYPHRRFGSQEILFHRENSLDSVSSASSFSKRQALLPQRVNRILSPSIYGPSNSVSKKSPVIKTDLQRRNPGKEEKSEVSASMATFLALEELCTQQSLTPRQAEAVFKASKTLMRKQNPENVKPEQEISAISLEEKRVMESLERLNKKLKEQQEIIQKNLTPRKNNHRK